MRDRQLFVRCSPLLCGTAPLCVGGQAYFGYTAARGPKLPKNYLIVTPGKTSPPIYQLASVGCVRGSKWDVEIGGVGASCVPSLNLLVRTFGRWALRWWRHTLVRSICG